MYKQIFNQVLGSYAVNSLTKEESKLVFDKMKEDEHFNKSMISFIYFNSAPSEIGELFKHMVNDIVWSMKNDKTNN